MSNYEATKYDFDGANLTGIEGIPTATIVPWSSSSVPTGFLECNGANISRSTYAQLYSALGTTWGSGDGSSTFGLPDLRGEFIRGWDNSRGIDSGRSFATSQADQNESHTHSVTDPNHSHTQRGLALSGGSGSVAITLGSGQSYQIGYSGQQSSVTTGTSSTGISLGTSGGTEARPRNVSLMYIIKF